jgi:hypothetical protein
MHQNNHNYKIVWQKWADPFGADDIEDIDQYLKDSEYYEENEETSKHDDGKNPLGKYVKVIATPMGIIPLNDNTASSKIFNFWTGHTNFDITKQILNTIEETSGVETLDIFTRYRFRISVGKVFEDSVVMREINDRVYKYLESYDDQ